MRFVNGTLKHLKNMWVFNIIQAVFEGAINPTSDYKKLAFKIAIVHEISRYDYLKN